jgi:N utilization substance protein B
VVGKRRASREVALRALYEVDVGKMAPEEALDFSAAEGHYREETLRFARELVLGCMQHRETIDETIEHHARGWTLSRMAHIDRNVLRLAVFEILYHPDVPHSVAVDEAVELAKKYSTAESGRFVNGVLGNLVRTVEGEQAEAAEP